MEEIQRQRVGGQTLPIHQSANRIQFCGGGRASIGGGPGCVLSIGDDRWARNAIDRFILGGQLGRERPKARRRIAVLVITEIGMLEGVEHIHAELHTAAAVAKAKVLLQRKVIVPLQRRA